MRHFELSEITGNFVEVRKYADVKKWIAQAIEAETQKSEKSLWENELTAEQVADLRTSTITRLSRRARNSEITSAIKRLAGCSRESRCCSAACHECGRYFQRAFVRAVDRFIRKRKNAIVGRMVSITIIPADAKIEPNELQNFDILNFVRRLKSKLKSANIHLGIGGVDFSFNEDKDGLYEPHWCPHIHIIGWTSDVKRLRADLKRLFPSDGAAIQRPIRVTNFDGTRYGISYRYKITFDRRVTYYDDEKRRRKTAYPGMCSEQNVELSLYLDQVGLGSRLILMGLKAYVRCGGLKLKYVGP